MSRFESVDDWFTDTPNASIKSPQFTLPLPKQTELDEFEVVTRTPHRRSACPSPLFTPSDMTHTKTRLAQLLVSHSKLSEEFRAFDRKGAQVGPLGKFCGSRGIGLVRLPSGMTCA